MKTLSALIITAATCTGAALAQDQATYQFEFVAEWSAVTHPTSFPGNPHFSPVTGATHNDQLSIWAPGGIATTGIEVMAESGGTSALSNEVAGHINAGTADQFLRFGSVPFSPGSTSGTIQADRDYPLLSLVTMIAPSPDWFVGIHDLNLRQDGVWLDEVIIDLDPYDSGTDAGVNYTSGNSNIANHLPIANIADQFPFTNTPRIGTLRITRTSDAGCTAADLALPYGDHDFVDISTFISAFTANESIADINSDSSFDFVDINLFVNSYTDGCP